jgi:hypothetical protein
MITTLSIKNYALIEKSIDFQKDFQLLQEKRVLVNQLY